MARPNLPKWVGEVPEKDTTPMTAHTNITEDAKMQMHATGTAALESVSMTVRRHFRHMLST
jgi:hypothetical protein